MEKGKDNDHLFQRQTQGGKGKAIISSRVSLPGCPRMNAKSLPSAFRVQSSCLDTGCGLRKTNTMGSSNHTTFSQNLQARGGFACSHNPKGGNLTGGCHTPHNRTRMPIAEAQEQQLCIAGNLTTDLYRARSWQKGLICVEHHFVTAALEQYTQATQTHLLDLM